MGPLVTETPKQYSPHEVVGDGVITSKVRAHLKKNPLTSGYKIDVETHNGVVQLDGFVESEAVQNEAVRVAREVEGVQQVRDLLDVRR